MLVLILSLLAAFVLAAGSLPTASGLSPLPLIIWHGLGDDFERDGLTEVAKLAENANPGTYVHLIRLADSGSADRQATFIGNVTQQIAYVCDQLASEPILSTAPAVNALGFSQGGQFLRGFVERCNFPRVHNLVTIGSQHNGIAEFQDCGPRDWPCRTAEALLRFGRWSQFVQARLVPAQYFRDPEELDEYLEHSNFLADINNERELKNPSYRQNLITLNCFAMYMFDDDTTVNPKESAWFAEFNATTREIIPLQERQLYKEDWLGLKVLDEQGRLDFRTVPGRHMALTNEILEKVFKEFFSPLELGLPRQNSLVKQGILGATPDNKYSMH